MSASLSAQLTSEIRAERERLAGLLADLSPEQWAAPSLCRGWRVQEVAAHITMPFRTKPLGFTVGLIGAGFSFNRFADRDARSTAREQSQAELVEWLQRRQGDTPGRHRAAPRRRRRGKPVTTSQRAARKTATERGPTVT